MVRRGKKGESMVRYGSQVLGRSYWDVMAIEMNLRISKRDCSLTPRNRSLVEGVYEANKVDEGEVVG